MGYTETFNGRFTERMNPFTGHARFTSNWSTAVCFLLRRSRWGVARRDSDYQIGVGTGVLPTAGRCTDLRGLVQDRDLLIPTFCAFPKLWPWLRRLWLEHFFRQEDFFTRHSTSREVPFAKKSTSLLEVFHGTRIIVIAGSTAHCLESFS